MEKIITSWYSPHLQKEMPVAVYGHYGFALLMIPTAAADYLEYERFQLIDTLSSLIDGGKLKVFSINSINTESWMNPYISPSEKSQRHRQFNDYVFEEVIPFIKTHTSPHTPIITCGASFGALHSMNLFLKKPELIKFLNNLFLVQILLFEVRNSSKQSNFFNGIYFSGQIGSNIVPNVAPYSTLLQVH